MNATKVLPPVRKSWWPRILIGYFAVFITGIASFIVFASRQRMDLVRTDYYDEEILFQKQMDSTARGKQLNLSVKYDAPQREVQITLPAHGAQGKVLLYRPSDARMDREVPLALTVNGTQHISASDLQPGLWKVRVCGELKGEAFYSDTSVVIGGF